VQRRQRQQQLLREQWARMVLALVASAATATAARAAFAQDWC
jgi:hypothetical protein